MTEQRERFHICLYTNSKTLKTTCVEVDEMTDDELDIFLEDIEWYFYQQGGQMRRCKFCGKKYPYFPYGIPYKHCFSDECIDKADVATLECHEFLLKREVETAAAASTRAEEREKERLEKQRLEAEQQERIDKGFGYIYIFGASNGLYKIGLTTTTPEKRLYSLKLGSPIPITLVHSFESARVRSVEAKLHKKFEKFRKHGEWFELTESAVIWLKNRMDYELD